MADTAIKSEEEKREYFDTPEELDRKVEQLAMMILASEHFVTFTGAGISTGAGIPDYRSGFDTVLKTGPGCWEKAATIQKAVAAGQKVVQIPKNQFQETFKKAMPTKCHMSFVKLMELGLLKHVISQNTDGLHRKSGIPAENITELHGNTNLEICKNCDRNYMRDFRTRRAGNGTKEHTTGRLCACGGSLEDSILNFGEYYRPEILAQGEAQGLTADLMLCCGSSMRVSTAAQCAENTFERGGKLVIVNLQNVAQTPMAAFQIYAQMDEVFDLLMKKLSIPIPEFNLNRYALAKLSQKGEKEYLSLEGIDLNGGTYDYFTKININGEERASVPLLAAEKKDDSVYQIKTNFYAKYNEPQLSFSIPRSRFNDEGVCKLHMRYNPYSGKWEQVETLCPFTNEPLSPIEFKNIGALAPMPKVVKPAAVPIKPAMVSTGAKAMPAKKAVAEKKSKF